MTRWIEIRLRSVEPGKIDWEDQACYEFKVEGDLEDFRPTFERLLRSIGVPESELTEAA